MGRKEILEGPITIAYGTDHISGYFLSVKDERLYDSGDSTDEVNKVCLNVTKGGGYFDVHTGIAGFGQHVSRGAMLAFWKRFGVPQTDIERIALYQEVDIG